MKGIIFSAIYVLWAFLLGRSSFFVAYSNNYSSLPVNLVLPNILIFFDIQIIFFFS